MSNDSIVVYTDTHAYGFRQLDDIYTFVWTMPLIDNHNGTYRFGCPNASSVWDVDTVNDFIGTHLVQPNWWSSKIDPNYDYV